MIVGMVRLNLTEMGYTEEEIDKAFRVMKGDIPLLIRENRLLPALRKAMEKIRGKEDEEKNGDETGRGSDSQEARDD